MCRRYCLFLVLWAIAPVPAQNTGGITGKILDVRGKPVQEMQVMLVGTDFADVTDATGSFFIENIRPGTYTLLLGHIAFERKRIRPVRIDSGHRLDLGIMKVRERILLMEGVIVSATRTSHLADDVSRSVNWVPETRISERNPRSTAEALREETGIFIKKTEHGGGSAILRGMGSNQILILVDGIRLNNATYRLGNH